MSDNEGKPPASPSGGSLSGRSPSPGRDTDELTEAARLQLAHELCLDENMQIGMPDPHSIYGQVKQIVHRAFWDSVRAGVEKTPPDYEHAARLIAEIRDILLETVPERATRIRTQIIEVMDMDLYKQQIEHDTFDLRSVTKFVVETMLSLCAPARDPTIRAILALTDPVDVFRDVFSALDLMRLDLANFQLKTLRPTLLANSVQYEQDKFRRLLGYNPAGLDNTKKWLREAAEQMRSDGQDISPNALLNNAFIRIIEEKASPVPESVSMDAVRFIQVTRELSAVVFSAAASLLLRSALGIQEDSLSNKVRVCVYQLCADELITHPRQLLPHISEQLVSQLREHAAQEPRIRAALEPLSNPDHPVYLLLWDRAKSFLTQLCAGQTSVPPPPGFGVCERDLLGVASKFTHLVSYNRAVFGPFYADIISEVTSRAIESSSDVNQSE